MRNKLTTNEKLHKFNNTILVVCLLCNNGVEDISHRFKNCYYAQELWKIDSRLPEISIIPSVNDWLDSLEYIDKEDLSALSKVLFVWWQMWNDRNDFVFRQLIPNPIRSFKNFSSIAKNFLLVNSNGRMDNPSRRNNIIRWHPPDVDFHKMNFDGSVIGTSAAAGFVIRDHHGHPLMAGARKLGQNTFTIA